MHKLIEIVSSLLRIKAPLKLFKVHQVASVRPLNIKHVGHLTAKCSFTGNGIQAYNLLHMKI